MEMWLKGESTCVASMEPEFSHQYLQKTNIKIPNLKLNCFYL
jgi:hypothetical protein